MDLSSLLKSDLKKNVGIYMALKRFRNFLIEEEFLCLQRWHGFLLNGSLKRHVISPKRAAKIKYLGLLELQKGKDKAACIRMNRSVFAMIRKNVVKKKICRVGFVAYSTNVWPCDELFQMMCKDKSIEPVLFAVCDKYLEEEESNLHCDSLIKMCREKGYPVIDTRCHKHLSRLLQQFDAVFYFGRYNNVLPKKMNVQYMPMSMLLFHIPYDADAIFDLQEYGFNLMAHKLFFRYYAPFGTYMSLAKKYADFGTYNMVLSGYPRFDKYYMGGGDTRLDIEKIWKIPGGKSSNEVIKIIYAPTHAIAKNQLGTFPSNYQYFLYLAEKYKDTTSWVFRPHQNLPVSAVAEGVFHSNEEYKDYLKRWDSLPNARCSLREDHVDIMKTSDCMVLDSCTFVAEYFYLNKPIFFLTKNVRPFSQYGEEILEAVYQIKGDDLEEIERTFITVIVDGEDTLAERRQRVFKKYLDYMSRNHMSASEFILKDFKQFCQVTR